MAKCILALLLSIVVFAGCGPKAPPPAPKAPPADEAKAALRAASESGMVSSDVLALKGYFEEVKKADAAKGDALLKDLDALIQAGSGPMSAATVKQKAKELLEKL